MKKKRHKQKQHETVAGEHPEPTTRPAKSSAREVVVDDSVEPRVSRSVQLPMLVVFLLGVLVYVGDMYLMNTGGAFHAQVYYPNTEVPRPPNSGPDGELIYRNNCSACHQPTGMGSPALNFPPLAGSDWVLAEGPNRLIRIVLNGLTGPIEVNGQQFNNNMLPWKDTMSDEEIAAVLSYIRTAWGNEASAVTPEQVTAIREATAGRASNWTAAELLRIPASD